MHERKDRSKGKKYFFLECPLNIPSQECYDNIGKVDGTHYGQYYRSIFRQDILSEGYRANTMDKKDLSKPKQERLASTVCELLVWTIPAGKPKLRQCTDFLEELESEGIMELPAKQVQRKKASAPKRKVAFDTSEITGDLRDFEPIRLKISHKGEENRRWRAYVDQYHMLGYQREFGSQMRYFIQAGGRDMGCLQFSASAWALEARDKWIEWGTADSKADTGRLAEGILLCAGIAGDFCGTGIF